MSRWTICLRESIHHLRFSEHGIASEGAKALKGFDVNVPTGARLHRGPSRSASTMSIALRHHLGRRVLRVDGANVYFPPGGHERPRTRYRDIGEPKRGTTTSEQRPRRHEERRPIFSRRAQGSSLDVGYAAATDGKPDRDPPGACRNLFPNNEQALRAAVERSKVPQNRAPELSPVTVRRWMLSQPWSGRTPIGTVFEALRY
jgi:hypothetical protein